MEMRDKASNEIKGAEAIVIHNGNIVLGMQSIKRWYKLDNGQTAAIVKTIGGKIEEKDEYNSKKAIIREVLEELKLDVIDKSDIDISKKPIFTKKIKLRDLNPYDKQYELNMCADFYFVKILSNNKILPNDLPVLIEIPIEKFLKLEFAKSGQTKNLYDYIVKNTNYDLDLPEQYALMVPEEVKTFLEKLREDEQI